MGNCSKSSSIVWVNAGFAYLLLSQSINTKEGLDTYLQNIDGQFIQYGYKNIIESTSNYDAVCKFIEYLAEKHFDTAKKDLISIISNFNVEEKNINKDLFDSTLKYCNDFNTSKQLVSSFDLIYGESGTPSNLTQNQHDTLITEEFIDKRIQKITNNKVRVILKSCG